MLYYLSPDISLKWLETKSVYHIVRDELYELDDEAFDFLKKCSSVSGCVSERTPFVDFCLGEGLLSDELADRRYPPVLRSPEPSLRYLELVLTDRCNLRCRHCYTGASSGGKELPAESVVGVLSEFESMQGLRVMLTGGEPLCHSKFWEINKELPRFSVRKVLFTNGLLLKKSMLADLNVDEIQFSIDGFEQSHDALRGKGTYRRTIAAAGHALDSGFQVSVATMVHRRNLGEFERLHRKFQRMGIKEWTVDIPCEMGNLRKNPRFAVTPLEGGKFLSYGFGEGMHTSKRGYACGYHLMAVLPDGGTAKCSFFRDSPIGHIQEGLRRCWSRIRPVHLKELSCGCEMIEECRGGCRFRAELLGGTGARDEYRCARYGIL
jgi:radical SAM protein with 4Fe4S-binding SPASM domain